MKYGKEHAEREILYKKKSTWRTRVDLCDLFQVTQIVFAMLVFFHTSGNSYYISITIALVE